AEPPASLPPLPEARVPVSPSSLAPPPPLTPLASLSPKEMEHPEIVFSPERIRRSLAKDPRLGKSLRRTVPKPSGIRTIVYDPTHVTTVKTAVSHVTLIDLPEEAKEVYLGDAKLFLAEVFGPRVKVKPITWDPKETTNMIVYTLHRQFAFRLRVVPEGEEDDLLTFYLPRSDTVVNLTPLRQKMEKDLALREQGDLRKAALKTLRRAGASEPVGVFSEKNGLRAAFLGFSSLGKERYALFEVRNKSRRAVRLSGIRLRLFKSSLFWEGRREWVEGEDFSRGYRLEILPNGKRRVLLPADMPPLSSSREGYLAELWIEGDSGGRQTFRLEAKGHPR
ncbi:MAG: TrbG/VirB9 family P-type conjugative transfer protein, partial [Nitrospiraceae bacterium]|nr:TrbG/VirB9 family P-type conjugative transfer protein [Nitrospiraceae bacterium]